MLYIKACPRCHGDIKLDRDNYGVFAKCLQCGFNRDFSLKRRVVPTVPDQPAEVEPAAEKRRKAA
jgi:hypothetical protein